MRDLFLLADEIQSFCQDRGWRFCFIGGIALQRWGEPRLTGDVDLTILTGFGNEAGYVEELCGGFAGRVADAAEFALRNRVLLLQSEKGIPIDISLGALAFEERVVDRATVYRFLDDVRLNTCSAEDLVVLSICRSFPRLGGYRRCTASKRSPARVGDGRSRARTSLRSQGGTAHPAPLAGASRKPVTGRPV